MTGSRHGRIRLVPQPRHASRHAHGHVSRFLTRVRRGVRRWIRARNRRFRRGGHLGRLHGRVQHLVRYRILLVDLQEEGLQRHARLRGSRSTSRPLTLIRYCRRRTPTLLLHGRLPSILNTPRHATIRRRPRLSATFSISRSIFDSGQQGRHTGVHTGLLARATLERPS